MHSACGESQMIMPARCEVTIFTIQQIVKSWLSESRKHSEVLLQWCSKILGSCLVFTVQLQAGISIDWCGWRERLVELQCKRQYRGSGNRDRLRWNDLETLPEFVGVASGDPKLKCSWDLHRKCNNKSFHCSVSIKRLSKENVEPLLYGGTADTGKAEAF